MSGDFIPRFDYTAIDAPSLGKDKDSVKDNKVSSDKEEDLKQSNAKESKRREVKENKRKSRPTSEKKKRTRFEDDSDVSANNSPTASPPLEKYSFFENLINVVDRRDDQKKSDKTKTRSSSGHKSTRRRSREDRTSEDDESDTERRHRKKSSKKKVEKKSSSHLKLREGSPPPSSSPDLSKQGSSTAANSTSKPAGVLDKDVVLWSPWEEDVSPRKALQGRQKKRKTSRSSRRRSREKRNKSQSESSDDSDYDGGEHKRVALGDVDQDYVFTSPWTDNLDKWIQERHAIRKRRKAAERAEQEEREKLVCRYDNLIPDGVDYVSPSNKSDDSKVVSEDGTKVKKVYIRQSRSKHRGKNESHNKPEESTQSTISSDSSAVASLINDQSAQIHDETENCRPDKGGVVLKLKRHDTAKKKAGGNQSLNKLSYGNYGSDQCSICSCDSGSRFKGNAGLRTRSLSRERPKSRAPKNRKVNQRSPSPRSYGRGAPQNRRQQDKRGGSTNFRSMSSKSPARRSNLNSTYNRAVNKPQGGNRSPKANPPPRGKVSGGPTAGRNPPKGQLSKGRVGGRPQASQSRSTSKTKQNARSAGARPTKSPSKGATNSKKRGQSPAGASHSGVSIRGPKSASDCTISSVKRDFDCTQPLETINVQGPLRADKNRRPLVEINIFGPLDQDCKEVEGNQQGPVQVMSDTGGSVRSNRSYAVPSYSSADNSSRSPPSPVSTKKSTLSTKSAKSVPAKSKPSRSRQKNGSDVERSFTPSPQTESNDDPCMRKCMQNCRKKCKEQCSANCVNRGSSSDSNLTLCEDCEDLDESANHSKMSASGEEVTKQEPVSSYRNEKERDNLEKYGGFMFSEYKKDSKKKNNVRTNCGSMFQTYQSCKGREGTGSPKQKHGQPQHHNDKDKTQSHSRKSQRNRSPSWEIPAPHSSMVNTHESTNYHNERNSTKATRNKAAGDSNVYKNLLILEDQIKTSSSLSETSNLTAPVLRLKATSDKARDSSKRTIKEYVKVKPKPTAEWPLSQAKRRVEPSLRSRSVSATRSGAKVKSKAKSSCYPYFYTEPDKQESDEKVASADLAKNLQRRPPVGGQDDKPKKAKVNTNKVISFRVKKYPETIWHKYAKAERKNQNWSNKIAEVADANALDLGLDLNTFPSGFEQSRVEDYSAITAKYNTPDFSSSSRQKTEVEDMSPMKLGNNKRIQAKSAKPSTDKGKAPTNPTKQKVSSNSTRPDSARAINGQELAGWSLCPADDHNTTYNRSPVKPCYEGNGDDGTADTQKIWSHSSLDCQSRPLAGRRVHYYDNAPIVSSRPTACMVDEPVTGVSSTSERERWCHSVSQAHYEGDCIDPDNERQRQRHKHSDSRQKRRSHGGKSNRCDRGDMIIVPTESSENHHPCPFSELNNLRATGRYRKARRRKLSAGYRSRRRSGPSPPSSSSSSSLDVSCRSRRRRPNSGSSLDAMSRSRRRPSSAASYAETNPKVRWALNTDWDVQTAAPNRQESAHRVESPSRVPPPSLESDFVRKDLHQGKTFDRPYDRSQLSSERHTDRSSDQQRLRHLQENDETFRAARRILGDLTPPSSEPQWHDRHVSLMGECSKEKMENAVQRVHRIHAKARHLEGSVSQLKLNFGDIETRLDKVRTIQKDYLSKAEEAVEMVRAGETGICYKPRDRSRNNASVEVPSQRERARQRPKTCSELRPTRKNGYSRDRSRELAKGDQQGSFVRAPSGVRDHILGRGSGCVNQTSPRITNGGRRAQNKVCGGGKAHKDHRFQKDEELLAKVRQSFGNHHDDIPQYKAFNGHSKVQHRGQAISIDYDRYGHCDTRAKSGRGQIIDHNRNCSHQTYDHNRKEGCPDIEEIGFSDRSSNNNNDQFPCWSHILAKYQRWVSTPSSDSDNCCYEDLPPCITKDEQKLKDESKNVCKTADEFEKYEDPTLERVRKWAAHQLNFPEGRSKKGPMVWNDSARRESGYESDFTPSINPEEDSELYMDALRRVVKDFVVKQSRKPHPPGRKRFVTTSKSLSRVYAPSKKPLRRKHSSNRSTRPASKIPVVRRSSSTPVDSSKSKQKFATSSFAKQVYKEPLPCKPPSASQPTHGAPTNNPPIRNLSLGKKGPHFARRASHSKFPNRSHSGKVPHRPGSVNGMDLPRNFTPITEIGISNQPTTCEHGINDTHNAQLDTKDAESIYTSDSNSSNHNAEGITGDVCGGNNDLKSNDHAWIVESYKTVGNKDITRFETNEIELPQTTVLPQSTPRRVDSDRTQNERQASKQSLSYRTPRHSHPSDILKLVGNRHSPLYLNDATSRAEDGKSLWGPCSSPPPPPPSPLIESHDVILTKSSYDIEADDEKSSCLYSDSNSNTISDDMLSSDMTSDSLEGSKSLSYLKEDEGDPREIIVGKNVRSGTDQLPVSQNSLLERQDTNSAQQLLCQPSNTDHPSRCNRFEPDGFRLLPKKCREETIWGVDYSRGSPSDDFSENESFFLHRSSQNTRDFGHVQSYQEGDIATPQPKSRDVKGTEDSQVNTSSHCEGLVLNNEVLESSKRRGKTKKIKKERIPSFVNRHQDGKNDNNFILLPYPFNNFLKSIAESRDTYQRARSAQGLGIDNHIDTTVRDGRVKDKAISESASKPLVQFRSRQRSPRRQNTYFEKCVRINDRHAQPQPPHKSEKNLCNFRDPRRNDMARSATSSKTNCHENKTVVPSFSPTRDSGRDSRPGSSHRVRFVEPHVNTNAPKWSPYHDRTSTTSGTACQNTASDSRKQTNKVDNEYRSPAMMLDCWEHSKRVLGKLAHRDKSNVELMTKPDNKLNKLRRPLSADANALRRRYGHTNFPTLQGLSPSPSPTLRRPQSSRPLRMTRMVRKGDDSGCETGGDLDTDYNHN